MKNSVKNMPFVKMHGLGNDYVYIDCFPKTIADYIAQTDLSALARYVSDRHFGIGSDGLVLILPSKEADAKMRIFNADGSEAQMCGNAIRCVAKYLYESERCRDVQMEIETLAGIRSLSLHIKNNKVDRVTVNMGVPTIAPETILSGADPIGYTAVNMGNPHAVFFRDQVPALPQNTNVEFVRVRNAQELDVRVIERGSGETLACGTGACATAVAASLTGRAGRESDIIMDGGTLHVRWDEADNRVYLSGPAEFVFEGAAEGI